MSGFDPQQVLRIDLADDAEWPRGDGRDAFAVVWRGDVPLAHVELTRGELACPAALRHRVAAAVAPAVGDRLFATGFEQPAPSRFGAAPTTAPSLSDLLALTAPLARIEPPGPPPEAPADVSLIVCTRGRPRELERALAAIGGAAAPPGEVLVVDNDPADAGTRATVEAFGGATDVPEPRPGLSVARNAGIRAARGRLIAFVDDDTAVHPRWLERLLHGFADPRVLAVTGLVLPAELDTRAQVVFETTMGSARRGYRPMVFDQAFFAPQTPFGVPVWAIGAGANMAFRREAFDRVGLFDERLGAGATGCSEDSELWYRILAAGGECRYVPDSVVLHWHRREMDALRRQAHDYMRGHVAALYVQFANHRHRGNLRRAALTLPKHLLRRALSELAVPPAERTGLLRAEVCGYLAGLREWRLALRQGGASR
jgi:GT2 family glycosyltransferase